MTTPRIGIIGEFNPDNPTHLATNEALAHAFARHGIKPAIEWLPTNKTFDLNQFDGFWCSPGSPYLSLDGALQMIHWARLERKPFIGTCAGFQHAVLEFARNVLGINSGMHAEYDPDASNLIVTPLTCSLVGKSWRSGSNQEAAQPVLMGRQRSLNLIIVLLVSIRSTGNRSSPPA